MRALIFILLSITYIASSYYYYKFTYFYIFLLIYYNFVLFFLIEIKNINGKETKEGNEKTGKKRV
jgi:phosphotransferase system  glucose/maltose/N-acetylglucosamine-specific IIC component